jgi:hypothetical protein
MEVGQGPKFGCRAKEKNRFLYYLLKTEENFDIYHTIQEEKECCYCRFVSDREVLKFQFLASILVAPLKLLLLSFPGGRSDYIASNARIITEHGINRQAYGRNL